MLDKKTGSLGQIELKSCSPSRGHSFASIFMKLYQNVCLDNGCDWVQKKVTRSNLSKNFFTLSQLHFWAVHSNSGERCRAIMALLFYFQTFQKSFKFTNCNQPSEEILQTTKNADYCFLCSCQLSYPLKHKNVS